MAGMFRERRVAHPQMRAEWFAQSHRCMSKNPNNAGLYVIRLGCVFVKLSIIGYKISANRLTTRRALPVLTDYAKHAGFCMFSPEHARLCMFSTRMWL